MRVKLLVPSLAIVALGVAGCGGGSSGSASQSTKPSPPAKSAGPLHIFRVRLLGGKAERPPGAPRGTGTAVIAFHGSSTVCWRFAHLHGFTRATFAHIHVGATGRSGSVVVALSTGPALHHQGCVPARAALVKAIERHPADYYVNIHSAKYPGGAVRAQL